MRVGKGYESADMLPRTSTAKRTNDKKSGEKCWLLTHEWVTEEGNENWVRIACCKKKNVLGCLTFLHAG